MRVSEVTKIAKELGFDLELRESDNIETEDDEIRLTLDGVDMNVHLQVDSMSDESDREIFGLYRQDEVETDDGTGWSILFTHYFTDSITEERVREFFEKAQPEGEALKNYNAHLAKIRAERELKAKT